MKEVPPRVVEKVWGKMLKMSRSAGAKMMEQMGQEQPILLAYLEDVDEDILNERERGILISLGAFFWQAMKQVAGILPRVSEDAMIRAEDATVKQAEDLPTEEEAESDAFEALLHACGQPALIEFAMVALLEAAGGDEEDESVNGEEPAEASEGEDGVEDDDTWVREENMPLLLLDLKTVIDVLNV